MEQANGTMAGGLLMIGASVAWAAYTVGARPLLVRYGALRVTAWTLWVGTTVLVIVGLPQLLSLPRSTFTPALWLAVLYAGALSIGLAYMIWYNGVRVIGNTRTAAYSNAVPVVALAVAWLWLGEAPSAGELIGSAVIIGGVTLAQTGR
jgi:drug/metabolite transporter (DMT)-like permease